MASKPPVNESDVKVVVMTAGGANPAVIINALAARWPDLHVIMEAPESKLDIARRRARRFGWINSLGQLATMIAARLLRRVASRRIAQICQSQGLDPVIGAQIPVSEVASINNPECLQLVRSLQPSVILLISTRLLAKKMLAEIPCPVLNLHSGINPIYRGQMGGYWSLVENDIGNFGATVHLVDAGTDTGGALYEVRAAPSKGDFISTYPMVLTAAAKDIVLRSVEDAVHGKLKPFTPEGPSILRFPPPVWTWLRYGLTRGIW